MDLWGSRAGTSLKYVTFVPILQSIGDKNGMNNQIISHDGVVQSVEGECVCVRILQSSACAGCAAKQMCSSAEAKEKLVEVRVPDASRYRVGQEVVLVGRLADGRRAAIISYG